MKSLGQHHVSRETYERLTVYHDLLLKWSPKINLVAKSTLSEAWDRHFVDSVQVFALAPQDQGLWVDIGSGGGFPGMVCAVLAKEQRPDQKTMLIESDQRKCAFLRTVIRELDLNAEVLGARIEKAEPQNAKVLSARALANLTLLLEFAQRHLADEGVCLFQKGKNWKNEVQKARESWQFDLEAVPSETDTQSAILQIKRIQSV